MGGFFFGNMGNYRESLSKRRALENKGFKKALVSLEESRAFRFGEAVSEIVYEQPLGCFAAGRALARLESGFVDAKKPDQPKGVLLFLGPTGTGKTETARALYEVMSGVFPAAKFIQVDATEYQQGHEILNILGAPPTYVGRGVKLIFDEESLAVPNVVLVDEVEKAHPDFHRLLVGIMEDGILTVNGPNGEQKLRFGNSIIVMTSNIGAASIEAARQGVGQIGFIHRDIAEDVQAVGQREVNRFFKEMPEFKSRVHEVVVYQQLRPAVYPKIVEKAVRGVDEGLRARSVPCSIIATPDFISWIADTKANEGARTLYNSVKRTLSSFVPDLLLENKGGVEILVDYNSLSGEICYYTRPFEVEGNTTVNSDGGQAGIRTNLEQN